MDEQLLLRVCIGTALIGILVVAVLPSLEPQQQYATLVWAEENRGRIEYVESMWVQTEHPIILDTPQCVGVSGVVADDTVSEVLLEPQVSHQEGCI